MLTQMQITAYAEELRRADEDMVSDCPEQWEWRLGGPQENRLPVAEWYREYEEQTGCLLGCD